MHTVYLVRHGLRMSRNEDTFLNESGVEQAHATGRALQNRAISQILVSPTQRTLQTAQILNHYLNVPIVPALQLTERMEYVPDMAGSFAAFLQEWDKTMADRAYQPPYGDSAQRAGDRLRSLIEALPTGNRYVLVSHGGVIGDLVRNIFPASVLPPLTTNQQQLSWLPIAECSITEIACHANGMQLKRVNDTKHLGSG